MAELESQPLSDEERAELEELRAEKARREAQEEARREREELTALRAERAKATNLRTLREAAGLSQSQLAKASGVGVRSIQLYEQRQKDLNNAQGIALYRLSRALRCTMEQLLER